MELGVNEPMLSKILKADPDENVAINVKMHALQWVKLFEIRKHRLEGGDGRATSVVGVLYPIIDKVYLGLKAAEAKKAKEAKMAKEPEEDDDDDYAVGYGPEEPEPSVGFLESRPTKIL